MHMSITPALIHALRLDDVSKFRLALKEKEVGRWTHDSSSYDLLMKAIKLGRKRIVNLLLDKGVRAFKKNRKNTPLHQAVMRVGWGQIVQKLLKCGAKVGIQDTCGENVLYKALRYSAPWDVMMMLLKAYAEEDMWDGSTRNELVFLHIASTSHATMYLNRYLYRDHMDSDINDQVAMSSGSEYAGYTALHFAVAWGKYKNAKILLKNNAEIYYQDVNGSTPLHIALERRNSMMIDLLLSYDTRNDNVVNDMGLSHFMAACAGSDASVVEQFLNITQLNNGPNAHQRLARTRTKEIASYPFAGYTPLHFAAEFGQVHNLHDLIVVGADLCALTASKMTPLQLAAKWQRANVYLFMQQICEQASNEASLSDIMANVNIQHSKDVNDNEHTNFQLQDIIDVLNDAVQSVQLDDEDRLSVVASECCVANTKESPLTGLESACKLLNI